MSRQQEVKERGRRTAGEDARARLLAGLPVTERRVQLAGVSTAVLEGGDGPPIVFLQGEFAAVWMRVIPELVRTHRVIAPDLPGLGASEVSDGPPDLDAVLKWLDELIGQTCAIPPVLVGKGPGGALAARFAIEHSDRIDRLVLVDTHGLARFRPPPGMALSFIGVMLRPTERGLQRGFRHYCFADLDGVRAEMGERYGWMAAYALDRFRTPSVKAAMRSLMRQLASAIPAGGPGPDRRSDDPDLGPPRSRGAAERRRGRQRPLRLAAARDRGRPRRPRHRAAGRVPGSAAHRARRDRKPTRRFGDEPGAKDGRLRARRDRNRRWRSGGPRHGVPPGEARSPVRDPGCERANRRRLAQAVGLASSVHPRALRRAAGLALPRARLVLPHQGRGRRLPGDLCG